MTIEQALNILCKKTYLVDTTNDDDIIELDQAYGVDITKDTVYLIFDCYIKDGLPEIYKTSVQNLIDTESHMCVSVERVMYGEEYKQVYCHLEIQKKEADSAE